MRPRTTYCHAPHECDTLGNPVFLNRSNRIRFIKHLWFQFALNHLCCSVPTEANRLCAGARNLDATFVSDSRTPNRGRYQRWIRTPQQSENGYDGYQSMQNVRSKPVHGDYNPPTSSSKERPSTGQMLHDGNQLSAQPTIASPAHA